ncbi:DDE-type integrase/transposase/recombinase [Deinococcus humi]|uniref:Transposase-like protein n=1 Tax=Deinococcus humi TaxID=662880 RepID=A0A7W8JYZ9_9DEIO|nr:DDE-type integrase/transposase/recombinase [Deinococcus humi]MBB5365408.1 transposase-like protein [Deinococcus humi]
MTRQAPAGFTRVQVAGFSTFISPVLEANPALNADHQQVISTSRCNNIIEQSHRPTRHRERQQQGFKRRKRVQEFLSLHARIENLHHHAWNSVTAMTRKGNQKKAFQTWSAVAAGVG